MEMIHGLPRREFVREPFQKALPPGSAAPPEGMAAPEHMGQPDVMPVESQPDGAALEVVDGKIVSIDPNVSGAVTAAYAKDVRICADGGSVGGVYAAGSGTDLTLEHANIRISGDGHGLGGKISGVYVEDHAKLTLRDCRIHMDGKLRCATSAADHSLLKVYDSTLISHGAPWPADQEVVTRVVEPGMAAPPYTLEVEGNMRTHCTVRDSESYFYNSTIVADSWAALSTDMAGDRVYLEANDCKIITTRSGYGTYADGNCWVVLNRCDLDSACMAAICGGEAGVTLNDCTAKCGNYVVLAHVVGFGGPEPLTHVDQIAINGGHYRCDDAAVLCKSCNADILLNGADIVSRTGVLVKSAYNDFFAPHPDGQSLYGIHVVLKDMRTENDIVHEDPERIMEVRLEHSVLTGAITKDVYLTMDEESKWVATGDSTVILNGSFTAACTYAGSVPGAGVDGADAGEGRG